MSLKRFPASQEYERNPKLSKNAVNQILQWVQSQLHLQDIKEEDAIAFLVCCQYDVEFAQQTIQKFYTFKMNHPELLCNRDPLDPKSNFSNVLGCISVMPGITDEGYKVLYKKILKDSDSSKLNIVTQAKYFICHQELMLHEEGVTPGWRIVYDMEYTHFSSVLRLSPFVAKNLTEYFQEASPMRLISIHLIHPKPYVTYLNNLMRLFLKKSVFDLIKIHTDLEDLYEYIPRKCLPSDCGGELPSTKEFAEIANNKIVQNRDILIRNENMHMDKSQKHREPVQRELWRFFGVNDGKL